MTLNDMLAMRDMGLPQQAREAFQAAISRAESAREAVAEAEASVDAARAARETLVQRAAGGEALNADELGQADAAIQRAENSVLFRRETIAASEKSVAEASENLRTAEKRGWEPVLSAAIAARIQGAEMIVAAKKQLADGEAVFAAGCAGVGAAMAGGVDLKLGFQPGANPEMLIGLLSPENPFPDQERRFWAKHLA